MQINYSVVIRTIGKAGDKYKALLNSIENLNPRPMEIIVVIPEGYSLPKERIGNGLKEKFIFSKKGMVEQRLRGIEEAKGEYLLICDDDISFDSDFVCRLYEPIQKNICKMSAGPLLSFFPPKGIRGLYNNISSGAVETIFNKDKYVHILKSSGWSYNRNINLDKKVYYYTESLPWTCFFAEKKALEDINLREEVVWLDKHGYASLDDQTMFYKAHLKGIETVVVSDAIYEHLDARTSTKGVRDNVAYSKGFNRIVFWHRFIFMQQKNIVSRSISSIGFHYYMLCTKIYSFLKGIKSEQQRAQNKIFNSGIKDGRRYIKDLEYKSLEKI